MNSPHSNSEKRGNLQLVIQWIEDISDRTNKKVFEVLARINWTNIQNLLITYLLMSK